jgi:hypothetical protein
MPTVHVTIVQHKCTRQVTVFTRSGEELLELLHGVLVRLRVGHVEHHPDMVGRIKALFGAPADLCSLVLDTVVRQIGPIVDKQTVRRHFDGYEEEEYPDRSGPDLYRAMRDYPRTGSGD